MNTSQAQFLPFSAINEFLITDYRQNLIQEVFASLGQLSDSRQGNIQKLVKRLVTVPGFRNSAAAPAPLKARAAVKAFERSSEFCAQILAAWADLHPELAVRVNEFMAARGWELLPLDAPREKLPGFLTRWPQKDTFEELDDAFQKAYPEDKNSRIRPQLDDHLVVGAFTSRPGRSRRDFYRRPDGCGRRGIRR